MTLPTNARACLRAHRPIAGHIGQTLIQSRLATIHLQLLVRGRVTHVALARLATTARLTEAHATRVITGRGAQGTAHLFLLLLQTPAQFTDLQFNVQTLRQTRFFYAEVLSLNGRDSFINLLIALNYY